jgi:hypothetical protein
MASIEDKIRELQALGAGYFQPVYPGESLGAWNKTLPASLSAGADTRIIWTNMDEFDAPSSVHGQWALVLTREVPDWRRENVQIYPFVTGQRVDVPGDEKIQDLDVSGYIVEQTGVGTTLDGKPYRVQICHVMFVKEGRVVRNHQYWGGADAPSMALTTRTLDMTRGEYRRRMQSKKGRAPA